jgi:hypothetical protein
MSYRVFPFLTCFLKEMQELYGFPIKIEAINRFYGVSHRNIFKSFFIEALHKLLLGDDV